MFRPVPVAPGFNIIRTVITICGHLLLALAALWLFLAIEDFAALAGVANWRQAQPLAMGTADGLLLTLIFRIFGSILANYAHAFWAEMQFKSLLVYLHCQGTYTESKLSTGTSIYDSTRSENTVVRSSMTPWIIASRSSAGVLRAAACETLNFTGTSLKCIAPITI